MMVMTKPALLSTGLPPADSVGHAVVYKRDVNGQWRWNYTLAGRDANFGSSAASDGDTVAVGSLKSSLQKGSLIVVSPKTNTADLSPE